MVPPPACEASAARPGLAGSLRPVAGQPHRPSIPQVCIAVGWVEVLTAGSLLARE